MTTTPTTMRRQAQDETWTAAPAERVSQELFSFCFFVTLLGTTCRAPADPYVGQAIVEM